MLLALVLGLAVAFVVAAVVLGARALCRGVSEFLDGIGEPE